MKKKNILYVLYVCVILTLTVYFYLLIIHNKSLLNEPYTTDEFLIEDLEAYKNLSQKTIDELTNSEGFKDYEHEIIKSNNTFRIIALGDSFTYGSWVSTNDSWPKQLETKLNKLNNSIRYEVLNFGIRGYNTEQEVTLSKRLKCLKIQEQNTTPICLFCYLIREIFWTANKLEKEDWNF